MSSCRATNANSMSVLGVQCCVAWLWTQAGAADCNRGSRKTRDGVGEEKDVSARERFQPWFRDRIQEQVMPESWRRVNEEFEDPELEAMRKISRVLSSQSPPACARILQWVVSRLESDGLLHTRRE